MEHEKYLIFLLIKLEKKSFLRKNIGLLTYVVWFMSQNYGWIKKSEYRKINIKYLLAIDSLLILTSELPGLSVPEKVIVYSVLI